MQRQDSNYSDMQSDMKADLYASGKPKKTSNWKSSAGDAHTRVMAEYLAEVPEEPKQIHNAWTYMIAVIMCMGAAAYGYDTGFFGGTLALDSFKRDFRMSERSSTTQANLVSLFQGGSFFGAGMQLPLTEKFGRKWTILFANVIFIASAFAQTFSHGSVEIFMVGRFLGGFAVGFLSLIIPVYLAEFSPPSIRGRLVGFFDIFIQVGTLAGFWINYGIDASLPSNTFQWQLPVFVQFFPAALLMGAFFVPESPRWLMSKNRYDEALKSLCSIRKLPADHSYIQYEIKMTQDSVETERAVRGDATLWGLIKELAVSPGHRKRIALGLALIFFKTFSGVQAVNYYSPRIFKQLGFKGTKNSLFATGIYGTVKFVGTLIFGFFVVDRAGRRWPLIIGSIGLSMCLFYIGGYLTAMGPRDGTQPISKGDYTAIVAIFLYATWYCFGWNSVPLTLISEIFNVRYRTISMTICLMWQWLCTFSIVRIMPIALDTITTKTYFLFGGIFIFAAPFVYFCVPETRLLSLGESISKYLDRLFDGPPRNDVEEAVVVPETEYKHEMDHIERLPALKE
ncbi:hypothetical protein QFC21_004999 [Naganishia friedmannii]|uniref:Uncharacterized protein n=1 Tax=Naganishia friedmannii TaxID=89922 RepID=A0ACC2VBI4_9TREE|nr:hypothetical protein QFC21_004999 [Naganishia friedmannii]